MQEKSSNKSEGLTTGKAAAIFAIVAVALLVLDRATKVWAESALAGGGLDFIPGFIGFTLVHNKGASFGMLQGATVFFVIITVVICAAIIVYLIKYKRHTALEAVILGLIFSGALGNAYDRLFNGQVTDFLHFEFFDFPVFNVADCCITIGIICWAVFIIFSKNSPFASKEAKEPKEQSGKES